VRAAIYARVSTEAQEKQATIDSQVADLRRAVSKAGSLLVKEYADDGYSGALLDRPALDRLRDDAKQKLFDEVWIHCPDRLSRKSVHLGILREEITKHGVRIVYLNRPDAKDTPEEKLLEDMEGAIAEYERAKILERTRRGKLHKAQRGVPVGGRAPYGYRYVAGDKNRHEDGHYEIEPEEAEVVRLIFRLLVHDRLSVRAIARELTRRGIPPQRGRLWRTSSLTRVMKNATYHTCVIRYNVTMSVEAESRSPGNGYRRRKSVRRRLRPEKEWVRIELPESLRIIEEKTFQQAQRQLALNSQRSLRNTKHQYLLSKLGRCGECDSPLYGSSYRGKPYYVCGNRQRTFPLKRECPVGSFRAGPLEDAVWSKVCEAVANPELILSQIGKLKERAGKAKASLKRELGGLDKSIAAIEQEERRVLQAYREEVISLEQLRSEIGEVNEKKTRLAAERQSILTRLDGGAPAALGRDEAAEYCRLVRERLARLNGDFEGRRRILGLLVNKIVVQGKDVRIKGIIPASSGDDGGGEGSAAIASTTHWCREHNTASFEFELEAAIP
jgi:site-specific DNA recombinase